MSNNKETQALFMEAMNSLKEYAKVNGGFVTKEDVDSYFKDMDLDENKRQMIYGYLMANSIKVKGEMHIDNGFLNMMESAVEHDKEVENEHLNEESESDNLEQSESNDGKANKSKCNISISKEDIAADEKYIKMYIEDLARVEKLSDTTKSFLLMNIVEDNDKESLRLLSESFLEDIVKWIEPYRNKGVLAGDLIQEGNLAMMSYIGEKRWLNNYEWKDRIKEGTTSDLMEVLKGIEQEVKSEIEGSLTMLIDEQEAESKVSRKVLNKVNLVNDWAVRLKNELGRKPTVDEVAEKMGISKENVLEAIHLSAENIEEINVKNA